MAAFTEPALNLIGDGEPERIRGAFAEGAPDPSLERLATRKCEIVGVSRVLGVDRFREAGQAAIHAVCTNVGERRRGGRALG